MIFNTHASISSDKVDVDAHAADVLQALVSVTSSLDRDTDNNLIRLFITRRCFKKIRMRFRSQPFEKPIIDILQKWRYDDVNDNLGKQDGVHHIVSPRLHEYFISARVPFQDTTDQSGRQGRGYLLNKHQALGWVNVLGNILISFCKGIEGFKNDQTQESPQRLVEAQKDLVAYLYQNPVVLTIFVLPSFTSLFRVHAPLPKLWTANSTYLPALGLNGPISFYERSVCSWSRQRG